VYHHPAHDWNVENMVRGTKKSLDYFSANLSPYQYRQFRIMEFPRYATFAQSFPNTIPFSEAIGFVADLRDPLEIDYVFYVTAHELAHQWWGHQVVGAQMQGMTVIVETLAQYSALMVMEHEYGADQMRRFLKYELDNYLRSRGGELIEELPLMKVENQPYIHYRKGSVVLYALKDAIGEDKVNAALRSFIARFGFGNDPFPTAGDLVAEFRTVAGPGYESLISDLFESIVLWDLRVAEASVREVGDQFEVTMTVDARQLEADGAGRETEVPLRATVDVAAFPPAEGDLPDNWLPKPLHLERKVLTDGPQTFTFTLAERPAQVAVDPYVKLIDRNPDDNLKTL
jgi:aminopeptidase N